MLTMPVLVQRYYIVLLKTVASAHWVFPTGSLRKLGSALRFCLWIDAAASQEAPQYFSKPSPAGQLSTTTHQHSTTRCHDVGYSIVRGSKTEISMRHLSTQPRLFGMANRNYANYNTYFIIMHELRMRLKKRGSDQALLSLFCVEIRRVVIRSSKHVMPSSFDVPIEYHNDIPLR
jgi:hypothetical protein